MKHQIHVEIEIDTDNLTMTCAACGAEILHASTGDKILRNKAADLGWKLASVHLCPGPQQASLDPTGVAERNAATIERLKKGALPK
jgi:hypothetical protein